MPAGTVLRGGWGWDGLIVVCTVAAYDGIRMSDWHLARHLSELAPVLYVDPPSFRHPAVRGPRRAPVMSGLTGPARSGAAGGVLGLEADEKAEAREDSREGGKTLHLRICGRQGSVAMGSSL